MSLGTINVTLRPIKFAAIVDLSDRDALLQAIQINTFLWGGTYNPIIPTFKETPANWSQLPIETISPQEILEGYIRIFDPDVLIACGKFIPSQFEQQGRMVVSAHDITDSIIEDAIPGYGIGLFEILAEVAQQEFKYVRRDDLKVLVPSFDQPTDLFLAAIFGDVPAEASGDTYEHLLRRVDTHRPRITLDNFLDFFGGRFLTRRWLCSFGVNVRRAHRNCAIFLFDHTNTLDVIDYWNLRAIGWDVLPIPKAVATSDKAKEVSREFIAENEKGTSGIRPDDRVTILKGRSISETDYQAFIAGIRERPDQIITCQVLYPPMWDEFTHFGGHITCSQFIAGSRKTYIADQTSTLDIDALTPKMMVGYKRGIAYANDVTISRYGLQQFGTTVIPPNGDAVARLFGFGLSTEWRVGENGLTFLGSHADWTIHIKQPDPRDVVESVLKSKGWADFGISPAGNIAYQMMRHLGGPYGIGLLKSRRLIKYLEDLSRTGSDDLAKTFFDQMVRINTENLIEADIHQRVRSYTEARIFTLGLKVQCPVCTQRSWHGLEAINYEVQCPKCLSSFTLPIHDPNGELKWAYKNIGPFTSPPDDDESEPKDVKRAEVEWAYKSSGPFAAPKRGGGAYSVLLAVNFLREFQHPSTTTVLSFNAKGKDNKPLEADFMMFYRNSVFWERQTEWVFGECKTFNKFKKRDIDRMQVIADNFPNSVLVFATLADEFSDEEKALIIPFVKASRAYGKLDRPRNAVLLLTGSELFSLFGPPQCWENKTGKTKEYATQFGYRMLTLLSLCNATQCIYLGLEPWENDWHAEFERRRKAAAEGNNDAAQLSKAT